MITNDFLIIFVASTVIHLTAWSIVLRPTSQSLPTMNHQYIRRYATSRNRKHRKLRRYIRMAYQPSLAAILAVFCYIIWMCYR